MRILEEEVLVCAVSGESNASDTEARKETSEAVEAGEGASVAPCLTRMTVSLLLLERTLRVVYALPGPGVPLGPC